MQELKQQVTQAEHKLNFLFFEVLSVKKK
jgi:hypothetical protein